MQSQYIEIKTIRSDRGDCEEHVAWILYESLCKVIMCDGHMWCLKILHPLKWGMTEKAGDLLSQPNSAAADEAFFPVL